MHDAVSRMEKLCFERIVRTYKSWIFLELCHQMNKLLPQFLNYFGFMGKCNTLGE